MTETPTTDTDQADHGMLCDANAAGPRDEILRPATREELLRSIAAGPEGKFGLDGRTVYVDRSHDELDDDVRALRAEAASAGDTAMVAICDRYLHQGDEGALGECAEAMLEAELSS
jgi:hypothetical protein